MSLFYPLVISVFCACHLLSIFHFINKIDLFRDGSLTLDSLCGCMAPTFYTVTMKFSNFQKIYFGLINMCFTGSVEAITYVMSLIKFSICKF